MKKLSILGGCLFALALTGCDYLDREPLDSIGKEQYFASASAATLEQYCNYFYPNLISGHGAAKGYSFGMMDNDLMSDDILRWERNTTSFGLHTKPSSASGTNWSWTIIRACNDFLENYEQSPAPVDAKQKYAGEILFFKTMDYFNKLKAYGDVPWYDRVLNPGDEDLYKARDSRTVVADNMLRDIDQAIIWLPKTSHVTRVGKEAALALKARFCLFEASWRRYHKIEGDTKFYQEAHDAACELMKSEYGYSLYEGEDPEAACEVYIEVGQETNLLEAARFGSMVSPPIDGSYTLHVYEFSFSVEEIYACTAVDIPVINIYKNYHGNHEAVVFYVSADEYAVERNFEEEPV